MQIQPQHEVLPPMPGWYKESRGEQGETPAPAPMPPLPVFLDNDPVVAAIPAYNEERFIGSVVLWVKRYVDLVLVIDDGSTDRTSELAEAAGAIVCRQELNRGKGQAVNVAFAEARSRHASALVLIDGDGQHRAEEINTVLEPVLSGTADMVVGSRFLSVRSRIPAYRQVGQYALTLATNLGSGVRLTDSQSGFRAFSRAAIDALSFRGSGFSVESEMQFLVREHGLQVAEVPISVVYEEPAKRNPIAHGMAVVNGIVRLISQGRPLFFFGVPGLLLAMLGLVVGGNVVRIYEHHQQLAIGYGMLSLLLTVVGILTVFTGIVLHALRGLLVALRTVS